MKKQILLMSLIISCILLISCARDNKPVEGVASSIEETGQVKNIKVTNDKCVVRASCNTNSPIVKTYAKNDKLSVINEVQNWYAVQLPNNQIGFVPKEETTPVITENQKASNNTTKIPNETAPPEETTPTAQPNNATPGTKTPQTDNTGKNAVSMSSMEQEMLKLVNEARKQNNVKPLEGYMELTKIARIKSQDMIDNNYFSHNSPTYGSPFDMMKQFGISYVKAGENIAGNNNVKSAFEGLMNSPGHRANILSQDYTHIGIGIAEGGKYGNMFTQMFVSRPQ